MFIVAYLKNALSQWSVCFLLPAWCFRERARRKVHLTMFLSIAGHQGRQQTLTGSRILSSGKETELRLHTDLVPPGVLWDASSQPSLFRASAWRIGLGVTVKFIFCCVFCFHSFLEIYWVPTECTVPCMWHLVNYILRRLADWFHNHRFVGWHSEFTPFSTWCELDTLPSVGYLGRFHCVGSHRN